MQYIQGSPWRRLLARAWFLWGQSLTYWASRLAEKQLYEWAVGAYGRALIAWPSYAEAYCRRGAIRGRELADYTGAVRDLTKAIELRPDWPEPYLQRGLFHRFHGPATARKAIEDLSQYLVLGGSDAWRDDVERQIVTLRDEIIVGGQSSTGHAS